jgi:hypothetical protein
VRERIRNLKTSQIRLIDPLPETERGWLLQALRLKRCVVAAECDSRALVVEYDADVWGSSGLLDFLAECRVPFAADQASS